MFLGTNRTGQQGDDARQTPSQLDLAGSSRGYISASRALTVLGPSVTGYRATCEGCINPGVLPVLRQVVEATPGV